MKTTGSYGVLLIAVIFATGCLRRDGRNSDCQWPAEPGTERLQTGQPGFERHLAADVEFAEELAIRYMDAHIGPKDLQTASQAKNRCMGIVLAEIGREHGITAKEAFAFFGKRNVAADIAMNLPFILLYALAADRMARRLRRRYPRDEGWTTLGVVAVAALGFGLIGLLLGGMLSGMAESLRVGNGHLSNRALRLPWNLYQMEIFALLVTVFAGVAACQYRVIKYFSHEV